MQNIYSLGKGVGMQAIQARFCQYAAHLSAYSVFEEPPAIAVTRGPSFLHGSAVPGFFLLAFLQRQRCHAARVW
jgi:hypothetical protein